MPWHAMSIPEPQRQQLVRLTSDGWQKALTACGSASAHAVLQHGWRNDWPWVVTRQLQPEPSTVSLGLPAPTAWGRQRLALSVSASELREATTFPDLEEVIPLLAGHPAQAQAHALRQQLSALGVPTHVYGSHGWQALTGEVYLHPRSDLDLLVAVSSVAQADAVVHTLNHAAQDALPHIDGELLWPLGGAVSWREWDRWRHGQTQAMLVKSRQSVHLQSDLSGLISAEHCA
jgi:phosphoribosyl-dephospho-CoA transferase